MEKCVFDKGASCSALKEKNCDSCGFYKTPEQHHASRARADRRIAALDEGKRRAIRLAYYNANNCRKAGGTV